MKFELKRGAALVLAAALIAGAAASAGAQTRAVDHSKSRIAFTYTLEKKIAVQGGFRAFSAQIVMDEAKPEAGSVRLEIDLLSIDTGSNEADTEVKRPLWFDVANHAKATFVSSAIRKLGENRYEALGKLTINGKPGDAVVPFTTAAAPGGGLVAQGRLQVKRLDFGVGTGLWADTGEISNEVEVRFVIALGPARPAAKGK